MIEGQPEYEELYRGPLSGSGWEPCYPDMEFITNPSELPSIWFNGQLMLGCHAGRKVFAAPITAEAINETLLTMDYHKDVKYILTKKSGETVELSDEGLGAAVLNAGDVLETKGAPDVPQVPVRYDVTCEEGSGDLKTVSVYANSFLIHDGVLHFHRDGRGVAAFIQDHWKRVMRSVL